MRNDSTRITYSYIQRINHFDQQALPCNFLSFPFFFFFFVNPIKQQDKF